MLLLYKTWGYYNKFDSMKSFGPCYVYAKMPWCGCMEHGLEYITCYVQKHIALLGICSSSLVRDGSLGAPPHLWDSLIGQVQLKYTDLRTSWVYDWLKVGCYIRAGAKLAPSQWGTSLQSNAVSHRLGANLESTLLYVCAEREGVAVIQDKYNVLIITRRLPCTKIC